MTTLHRYDLHALRARFPALKAGSAHFDGAGGTQIPEPVIDAIADALSNPLSNRGASTAGERRAEAIVVAARRALADLLGADPAGVVFGRSATQLVFDFSRTLAGNWAPGDEVVVTRLDHECNIRPWVRAAAQAGAVVRWADFDPATGELTADHVREVLSERTRVVAVTAASNLIGTRPDIPGISRLVHEAGALFFVDAAHYSAHAGVDMAELGADFLVCSAYKFLGPHLGVLAGRPGLLRTLWPDKLLAAMDDVPERFELGILPYEILAGARATVDFLAELGGPAEGTRRERLVSAMAAIEGHEDALRVRLEEGLAGIEAVTSHSRASRRTPTLLLTVDGHDTRDVSRYLAARAVDAGSGSFYAVEASRRLGLGDLGGLRVSLAPYSSAEDVDRLLDGLSDYLTAHR
ncbi:cysteine desulfurase-like protein [Sphaerisporangium krabiense]|uniref:Cysteine desulfurase family protein (TIGR01976 family) n=1 Tax=Sphaerisporangium krabiense TaxID=763782 RepID=A0A7W8Z4W8_9ACTN|nr:cysteine desulfurase-like protein [Sphaerisporangium krabiense]MBB5627511.1 cysteine desulfurase family protein (TIGR01976 family) [Sphaerisporangium krabiense]GII66526.1 cysteine desulfurase-like protein [Sphaerisporangium krabiense]